MVLSVSRASKYWNMPLIQAVNGAMKYRNILLVRCVIRAVTYLNMPLNQAVVRAMKYWNLPMVKVVSDVIEKWNMPLFQYLSIQICLPLFMLVALPLLGGDDWTMEKSAGDVRIFSKRTEGFPLKEFRGECDVQASLETVRSLMMDIDNYHKWFAMTRRITVMHRSSPSDVTVNYIVASPWPVPDRETDIEIKVRFDDAAGNGVVLFEAVQNGENNGSNGLVRINDMRAKFVFTRIDDRRTRAILTMRVDPRIDMPVNIQNNFLCNYPLDTLRGLKKMTVGR